MHLKGCVPLYRKSAEAPKPIFSGSGWSLWNIYVARVLCMTITSTFSLLRRSQQTQHVQQLHSYIRHRHLRPLFSSAKQNIRSLTSVLHHCQSRNTWPRLMNINFQSRFSAQWNTPFTDDHWCIRYFGEVPVFYIQHRLPCYRTFNESSEVAEMGDRARAKWAEKWGRSAVPLSVRELGPHLTQCSLGRGLPPY